MTDDTSLVTTYDMLLHDESDSAAIVIRERLRPVHGSHGVFFPPTFAGVGQGRKSDYHIDRLGPRADDPQGATRDGVIANRCTVDSVPSQANRLEARLLRYSGSCIPRVTLSGSRVGQTPLDLLEIGHRVADAALRYTANDEFKPFEDAMRAYVAGDSDPLARLAPTSLVFGHWDSRGETKSKARRLIRSEIVAYNVARATKRSQYWSSIDPDVSEEFGGILAEGKEAASRDPETKNPASQLGMTDVPAPESPGGVIAFGPIERTTIIALSGVRALAAFRKSPSSHDTTDMSHQQRVDPVETLALRRYLLALALAAAADPGVWDLREGCILVRHGTPPAGDLTQDQGSLAAVLVKHTGEEEPFTMLTKHGSTKFLEAAAARFFSGGVPAPVTLTFDPTRAHAAVEARHVDVSGGPKKKKDLIAALAAIPAYAGQQAVLTKKKVSELQQMWHATQAQGGAQDSATGEPVATRTES